MPAPSRTISKTRWKADSFGIDGLLFRRVVSIARADLCLVFQTFDFELDGTEFSVTSFIGRIVTNTVKRADVSRHARKRRARICQRRRSKASAAGSTCKLIHLAARQVVKLAADRHSFKRAHLAEAVEIFRLRLREEELAVTLNLLLRKCELTVVVAILHQANFDKVFGVDLNEVTSNASAR